LKLGQEPKVGFTRTIGPINNLDQKFLLHQALDLETGYKYTHNYITVIIDNKKGPKAMPTL